MPKTERYPTICLYVAYFLHRLLPYRFLMRQYTLCASNTQLLAANGHMKIEPRLLRFSFKKISLILIIQSQCRIAAQQQHEQFSWNTFGQQGPVEALATFDEHLLLH